MKEVTASSDAPGSRIFMLGNEAIARGAIEAGIRVAAAYPGTPSSEITETLAAAADKQNIYVEWSTNEKVAFEVAFAASLCGVRALACMKHVGVNVAHDPLMTASYIGARGGFVILTADDPWAWSSQNEQDNRYIAEQAYLPVLEPSSVQEAKDMMAAAFELSEKFNHIFMFRSVTRIGHARSDVLLGNITKKHIEASFDKDAPRLVYTPAGARRNKPLMLKRFESISKAVNHLPFNNLNLAREGKLGIIASGLSYSYTLEALGWLGLKDKISLLKIGTPHPLPRELVVKLLKSVPEIIVIEELEPFVENHVKIIAQEEGLNIKIHGKDLLPTVGELSTAHVTKAIARLTGSKLPTALTETAKIAEETEPLLPWRPPALCPGCPHRASHYAIKQAAKRVARDTGVEPVYPGDIGCYTLGGNPPLEAIDIVICMGAGYGLANGFSHVLDAPIVTHLGDSTFFHAGIPPLINAVYNNANITMVVLDNSATAMTGFQPHPGTGQTATGKDTISIKPEDVAKACGVKFVEVIDPFEVKKAIDTLEQAIRFEGPSFVVSRSPCDIIEQREKRRNKEKIIPYYIDPEKCSDKCTACINLLGCPAIIKVDGKVTIDENQCPGCGLCAQICPHGAIIKATEE